jgi:hypothetical protein
MKSDICRLCCRLDRSQSDAGCDVALGAASLCRLCRCLEAAACRRQAVSLPHGRSLFGCRLCRCLWPQPVWCSCVVASWPQPVWCRLCRCLRAAAGWLMLCRCLSAAASLGQLCRCLVAAAGCAQAVSLPHGRSVSKAGCVVASWPQPVWCKQQTVTLPHGAVCLGKSYQGDLVQRLEKAAQWELL